MATPSTPPSRDLPLDNPVEPIIISGAPPSPHTAPLLDNPFDHPVPSSQPPPSSVALADRRSQALRALFEGYRSLDVPSLLAPLAPDFTHEVLPQSLNMPVRGREDFAHHAGMVFSAFKSFEMKPMGLWEDPDRGEVILRCAMEGVLKAKKPEGGKEVGEAEENGQVEEIEAISPTGVDAGSNYSPNPSPDLLPIHLNDDIPGDLSQLNQDQPLGPGTVLSPITEVTEPPSEVEEIPSFLLPPPYFDFTSLCFREPSFPREPPVTSPPLPPQPYNTPMSSRRASPPPSSSFPLPPSTHQDAPCAPEDLPPASQESQNEEETAEIHWTNECLLIITFAPSSSEIAQIQEFVDSAKAKEMMKKHAPKGFSDSAASDSSPTEGDAPYTPATPPPPPPPANYKPPVYLDLDSLKLKDASMPLTSVTVTELPPSPVQSLVSSLAGATSPRPTIVGFDGTAFDKLDKGVQCSLLGFDSLEILDTLSTATEYPSSGRKSVCLDAVAWHHADRPHLFDASQASSSGSGSSSYLSSPDGYEIFQGVGQNASALLHRLQRTERRRMKRLRFSEQVEDIGFSSGPSSSISSVEAEAGSFSDSESAELLFEHCPENEEGRKETGWGNTMAGAVEVLREFVPSQLMPVDVDERTREVTAKSGWKAGAGFVAGLALGAMYDRRRR